MADPRRLTPERGLLHPASSVWRPASSIQRPSSHVRLFEDRPTGPADTLLLLVVVGLVLLGFVVVSAATLHRGTGALVSQVTKALVGAVALVLGMQMRHTVLGRRFGNWLAVMSLGALAATLVLGFTMGAARRWLGSDGFSLQPAEVAKIALVIWLAGWYSRLRQDRPDPEKSFRSYVAIPGAVAAAFVILTLVQPAIGTSFIMAVATLVMFFVVGVRWQHILLVLLLAAGLFLAAVTFIDYPRQRWQRFLSGDTYHQEQSLIAIGSGGPTGKGLGEGKQKYFFLPKMHNDFIFAEVGEEFGFIGTVVVFGLYVLLLWRGMRAGRECSGEFGQFVAVGFTGMLSLYAVVHVAVTLKVVPTTGQPLPFVSFGGSALVSNLFAAGVLLNVSKYRSSHAAGEGSASRRPVGMPAWSDRSGSRRPFAVPRPVAGRSGGRR